MCLPVSTVNTYLWSWRADQSAGSWWSWFPLVGQQTNSEGLQNQCVSFQTLYCYNHRDTSQMEVGIKTNILGLLFSISVSICIYIYVCVYLMHNVNFDCWTEPDLTNDPASPGVPGSPLSPGRPCMKTEKQIFLHALLEEIFANLTLCCKTCKCPYTEMNKRGLTFSPGGPGSPRNPGSPLSPWAPSTE